MICYYYEAPQYFFFASEVPEILYYSHIPAAITALAVGAFVFFNARNRLPNILLFLISLCFSGWILVSLTAWTNVNSDVLLFAWTFYGVFFGLISILSIYFIEVFLTKEDIGFGKKLALATLITPILLLAHTDFSLSGFDLALCDAFQYEGLYFKIYTNLLGLVAVLWIGAKLIVAYRNTDNSSFRKQIVLMGVGIELFLFSFFAITFFATYLTTLGFLQDSRLELYGLFGMTFFMAMIGFLIVRFKAFNVGMLAARALVIALLILVGSQFTYVDTKITFILTGITFVLVSAIGVILVRNVKREVEQRQEIERLATRLAAANKKLKQLDKLKSEFVSIASHQLRSPLTSIRGYASMLIEGSFGNIPQGAIEPLTRIEASAKNMAMSVEDYLNVSRIESGNMKYELSDFNLKEEAEKIADDIRPQAMKKGLLLTFKSDLDSKAVVHADIGKTVQILHNLINNSMKYTPKGSITVFVHDDVKKKQIYVEIIDTGIGIAADQIEHIFAKFERAKGANNVNTSGTGLGLFVAQKMAQEMKGDVTAHSEGEGKGSHFILTLPLAM